MEAISKLLEANKLWASKLSQDQPDLFAQLSKEQNPNFLWIGCSDSRMPAHDGIGLLPGELFVHRNIANIVDPKDVNCLSVVHYAVSVLKVKHIIVCGHYGCGGIEAATENCDSDLLDHWLSPIREIHKKYKLQLNEIVDKNEKLRALCRLNIVEQITNLCRTEIMNKAWRSGQQVAIHGWVYQIQDGIIHDLIVNVRSLDEIPTNNQIEEVAFLNTSR